MVTICCELSAFRQISILAFHKILIFLYSYSLHIKPKSFFPLTIGNRRCRIKESQDGEIDNVAGIRKPCNMVCCSYHFICLQPDSIHFFLFFKNVLKRKFYFCIFNTEIYTVG